MTSSSFGWQSAFSSSQKTPLSLKNAEFFVFHNNLLLQGQATSLQIRELISRAVKQRLITYAVFIQ